MKFSVHLRLAAASFILVASMLGGCAAHRSDHLETDAPRAQLFDGLGTHLRTMTTDSEEAQRYFGQGMAWTYAFNHDEAIRSLAKAALLDPKAAMPWWGIALCEGPNYNDPIMTEERSAAAWSALQEALARIDQASPRERALIEALSTRYQMPWPKDRSGLNEAYAAAMAEVWAAYPEDSDIGTLYAEALMVRRPWQLYTIDRQPEQDTPTIVQTLEKVLKLDPGNPGANHLYIHAVEPSREPGRALPAADRLRDQMPGSGHMVHMPSHIYIQTGRWDDSITQNSLSMQADVRYRELSPEQGIQHMYMVHNAHMLAFSAMMSGREKEATAAARSMWADIPAEVLPMVAPYVDLWMTSVYDVQKRFGRWDAILAEPAPPEFLPITTAVWRAHRAIARAAKKDIRAAELEYAEFRTARDAIPKESVFGRDPARRILAVSDLFIAGEVALQTERWDDAADLLERAVAIEISLGYGEPPQWLQPTRHTLGAVYIEAGRFADAERVYRADLRQWPDNGWSLCGLARALEAQGKTAEAEQVQARFDEIWSKADEPIATSCKCLEHD